MKLYNPPEEDHKVDLTPMIDIVFLLIVFFMTVANILTAERIKVEIPVAQRSVIPEDAGNRQLVSVTTDGKVFAGVREVSSNQLTELVRVGNKELKNYRVVIRADRNTPHRFVRDVMNSCARGGCINIIFSTYQSDL